MRVLTTLVLAALMAGGTLLGGWYAVPAIAAVWGLVAGRWATRGSTAGRAAIAGALAWGALLAADGVAGNLGALGRLFGAIASQPPAVFLALTLLFPAVLAWSASALAASVWRRGTRPRNYVPAARVLADHRPPPRDEVRARG